VIVEIADLAAGAVGEDVLMPAGAQHHVGRAGIDADAVGDRLGARGLVAAVARDRDEVEIDADGTAVGIFQRQREIAEDAAADLVALGIDGDGFRHRHRAAFSSAMSET
jgi:hypothetical protein